MDLTKFTFFKNTPFKDFMNTIHFINDSTRDDFFDNHYEKITFSDDFNYIRDKSTILIDVDYHDFAGFNYCRFYVHREQKYYYAYVVKYAYVQPNLTEVTLLIDGIMTFTQGHKLETLTNLKIDRQHLTNQTYKNNLWELKNNSDILATSSKSYFYESGAYFKDLFVLIHSSADLTSEFGDENKPNIKTSTGSTVDMVSSPLDIYIVEQNHFKDFMTRLSAYPWIAQNIKEIILMPKDFIDTTEIESVETKFGFNNLKKLKNGTMSQTKEINATLKSISKTMTELYNMFWLDPINDQHLLRSGYYTLELYTFDGQNLNIDLGQLNPDTGFNLLVDKIIGYENEIAIYLENYKVENKTGLSDKNGSYINDALFFKYFDTVPVLIDNAKLGRAKTANQRNLTESKLISNRIKNVADPNANLQDRFYNSASLISNLNPTDIFGKFNDEYDYYRQQKAEIADLQLETPTITEQTNSNSFQIRNGRFGVTMKCSKPNERETWKFKKYYNLFGFQWERDNERLENVQSMSICNYVKFNGSWILDNVDIGIIEMMKAQFENGVRLWHNNGSDNPMNQDVRQNVRVV